MRWFVQNGCKLNLRRKGYVGETTPVVFPRSEAMALLESEGGDFVIKLISPPSYFDIIEWVILIKNALCSI